MIKIFNLKEVTNYRLDSYKGNLLKRQVARNLEMIYTRLYDNSLFAPNDSLEVKLLRSFCPNIDLTLETFIEEAKGNVNKACRLLGIGSFSSTADEKFESNFGNSAIFIYKELNINLLMEYDNILSHSGIKYIYHGLGDVSFRLPIDSNIDAAILVIDPVLLMVQYKKWAMDRKTLGLSNSINIFCGTFMQLSILPSLLTVSFFNICTGTKVSFHKHSIAVIDISGTITVVAKNIIKRSKDTAFSINGLLNIIPTTSDTGFYDYIFDVKPGIVKRDSRWAVNFFFLNIISRLDNITSKATKRKNSRYYKSLKWAIKVSKRLGVGKYTGVALKDIYDAFIKELG